MKRAKASLPSNIAWDLVFFKNFLLEFSFTWGLRNSGSSSSPYVFLYSDITCKNCQRWSNYWTSFNALVTWCDQMAGKGTSPSNLQSMVSPMFFVSHLTNEKLVFRVLTNEKPVFILCHTSAGGWRSHSGCRSYSRSRGGSGHKLYLEKRKMVQNLAE